MKRAGIASNMTDEELFEEFRKGRAEGFDELVRRYKNPLFSFIIKRMGNRETAEDIFQETFMRIIEHADDFDSSRRFSPWMWRIALNLCTDRHRMTARKPESRLDSGLEPVSEKHGPLETAERAETRGRINEALSCLTEEQREVFIMREYSGMSFKEIALATDSPLNTVLGRMHGAMKKLRVELSAKEQQA